MRGLALTASLVSVFMLTSCDSSSKTSNQSGLVSQKTLGSGQMSTDQIQSEVMSFADTFASRMDDVIDRVIARADTATLRSDIHRIKINAVTGAYTIASNPNPAVALMDMAALVRIRMQIIEQHGMTMFAADDDPKELVDILLASYRQSNKEIWAQVNRAFTPAEVGELNELIVRWQEENPDQMHVTLVKLTELAEFRRVAPESGKQGPGSLFSLFYLDPLSSMNPTAREIEQTRRIAERAFFIGERTPMIMAWQVEQVVYDLVATREAQQLLGNANALSDAAKNLGDASRQWPHQLAAEREAMIRQLNETLEAQRRGLFKDIESANATLQPMLVQMKATLEAGSDAAKAVDAATLAVSRLAYPPETAPVDSAGHPFDPREYQAAAVEIGQAARAIQDSLKVLEQIMSKPEPASVNALSQTLTTAEDSGQRLIDRAFRQALLLIVLLLIGAPIMGLIYRAISRKIAT